MINFYGKISNSGSDERGKYSGGAAGDQTGREWAIINWYNRPWTCVLRHPDPRVREKIAELSVKAAQNNHIGYDQNQRMSYWANLQKANYDPSLINVNCEADCSAGVIANTKAAGYLLGIPALKNLGASYTGDMKRGFQNAGFQVLTESKYLTSFDYLLPGDILLYEGHHTAVNLGIGSKATVQQQQSIPQVKTGLNKNPQWVGKVIASTLNVRTGAGTNNPQLKSYPSLAKGNLIDVCDTVKATDGSNWYYIRIAGKFYGFAAAAYITRV